MGLGPLTRALEKVSGRSGLSLPGGVGGEGPFILTRGVRQVQVNRK